MFIKIFTFFITGHRPLSAGNFFGRLEALIPTVIKGTARDEEGNAYKAVKGIKKGTQDDL